MKRITHLVVAAALAAAGLAMLSSPARAQGTSNVTITFRLTLTGTVPSHDIFVVTFPVNGAQFCGPCVGGHTYEVKVHWAKGTEVVPFQFVRETFTGGTPIGQGSFSIPPSGQHIFAQVNVRPTANQTINAFFAYGATASLQVPATGAAASFPAGAGLVAAGSSLLLLGVLLRRRSRTSLITQRRS